MQQSGAVLAFDSKRYVLTLDLEQLHKAWQRDAFYVACCPGLQEGPNELRQMLDVDGLLDRLDRATSLRAVLHVRCQKRGHHDDGDVNWPRRSEEQHAKPIQQWHLEVRHQQRRRLLLDHQHSVAAIRCREHTRSWEPTFQSFDGDLAKEVFVFDEEHEWRGHAPLLATFMPSVRCRMSSEFAAFFTSGKIKTILYAPK